MILPVISSTLYYLSSYSVFLMGIPIMVMSDSFRNQLLPRGAYYLGFSKVGVDQYLQAIAVATLLVYFVLNNGADILYILRLLHATWLTGNVSTSTTSITTSTETTTTTTITTVTESTLPAIPVFATGITTTRPYPYPCTLFQRLSNAYQQIVLFYPAFITSTALIWANTTVFDRFNTAFVMIQAFFLLLMPVTFAIPWPLLGQLNSVGYRCAVLWTLIYALYSREMGDWIDQVDHTLSGDTSIGSLYFYITQMIIKRYSCI